MLRTARIALLSVGLMLAMTLATSSVTTMAASSSGSGVCGDSTPYKYLSAPGAQSPAHTDPNLLSAIATYKSQHDTQPVVTAAAKAAGEAASAQKQARINALISSGKIKGAVANVSHFSSRSAISQVCRNLPASNRMSAKLVQAAGALVPPAYACASNVYCTDLTATINYLNQQGQQDNTWCGPATVSEIAATEPGPSWVTQLDARNWISAHQGYTVESNGSDRYVLKDALNNYVAQPNLGYAFYVDVDVPSYYPSSQERSDFNARLRSDVWNMGYAVAGNVLEVAGSGIHLPGHPGNIDIGHYIEIGGFDDTGPGSLDFYADSATTVWSGVPAYAWYNEYDMVTLIGGRGYVW